MMILKSLMIQTMAGKFKNKIRYRKKNFNIYNRMIISNRNKPYIELNSKQKQYININAPYKKEKYMIVLNDLFKKLGL